jgi:16S rRNA (guanine527-N7)-methyltransferase
MMELILKYFPELSSLQVQQFSQLQELYNDWNSKINVISRKDIDELYERHVLHSLAIAKVIEFAPKTKVLDVGTGGGFPGIPLAIFFPEVKFHLVDSIGKKLMVINEVCKSLHISNVTTEPIRAEDLKDKYHFVVSRAVTAFPEFYEWVKNKFLQENFNALPNGILYLKGGDLTEELKDFPKSKCVDIRQYFSEQFFETKKVVYLSCKQRR